MFGLLLKSNKQVFYAKVVKTTLADMAAKVR